VTDRDWSLILPAMLLYGAKTWLLAWYGWIFRRTSYRTG